MSEQHAPVLNAPAAQSRRFLPLTTADQLVIVIVTIWTLLLLALYQMTGALVGIAIGIVLLWSLPWGKVYDRVITNLYDFTTTVVYLNVFWENIDLLKSLGEYVRPAWWRRALQLFFRRRHPYPIRVDWINHERFGEVGLGYNQHEHTDSIVFTSDGSDVSRKEPATRFAMIQAFGNTIKRLSIGGPVTVTMIIRPRPSDGSDFDYAIDQSHHPEGVVPASRVNEEETGLDAEQLYQQDKISKVELRWARINGVAIADTRQNYEENGREVEYAVVITVPRDSRASKAASRRRNKPLSTRDVRRLPLTRVLKIAHTALENLGAEGLRVLNRQELEAFCNITGQPNTGESALPSYHPKSGMYGDRQAIVIDNKIFVAYRVKEMPVQLGLNDITRLSTHTSAKVTLALTGENSRGKIEGSALYWVEAITDGLTENMRLGKSAQKGRAKLDEASNQIVNSQGVQYMNILLIVHGEDDADQIAEDCDSLEREAGADGFILEPAPGSSLQLRALLAAQTGMVGF